LNEEREPTVHTALGDQYAFCPISG